MRTKFSMALFWAQWKKGLVFLATQQLINEEKQYKKIGLKMFSKVFRLGG